MEDTKRRFSSHSGKLDLFKACSRSLLEPFPFSGLILSCLALFVLGILYEGVKWLRLRLATHAIDGSHTRPAPRSTTSQQLRDFILYTLQLSLAYALMLVVMTYNVWLSIAVILGAATGNFIFSRFTGSTKNESLTSDACH